MTESYRTHACWLAALLLSACGDTKHRIGGFYPDDASVGGSSPVASGGSGGSAAVAGSGAGGEAGASSAGSGGSESGSGGDAGGGGDAGAKGPELRAFEPIERPAG